VTLLSFEVSWGVTSPQDILEHHRTVMFCARRRGNLHCLYSVHIQDSPGELCRAKMFTSCKLINENIVLAITKATHIFNQNP